GDTPIDLAHQVHSPLLIHMLNVIKRERIRSNSRCLRVAVLFTLNATALLYYFLRTCRTDPGFIKATEEQRKMVGKVLKFVIRLKPSYTELFPQLDEAYWTSHCSLHYEDQGLWGVLSAAVSCSPWVLTIFVLSFYHTCWSTLFLIGQLYQVTAVLMGFCGPLIPFN
ncbi:hypothetical protein XENOCAPTIV_029329, partial [Xenoophorus captivus]